MQHAFSFFGHFLVGPKQLKYDRFQISIEKADVLEFQGTYLNTTRRFQLSNG